MFRCVQRVAKFCSKKGPGRIASGMKRGRVITDLLKGGTKILGLCQGEDLLMKMTRRPLSKPISTEKIEIFFDQFEDVHEIH